MANSATGRVKRLYVDDTTCFIQLEYNAASSDVPHPANDYFQLKLSAPNYNAQYSLALAAAENGHELWIRATGNIVANAIAIVGYLVVDY